MNLLRNSKALPFALGGALACLAASTSAFAAPSQCETVVGNLVANCGFEIDSINDADPFHTHVGGWTHQSTGTGIGIGPGERTAGNVNVGGLTHSGVNSYNAFFQNLPVILVPELGQTIETIVGHTYRVDWFQNLAGPADATAIIFAQIDPPPGNPAGGANLGTQTISVGSLTPGYHQFTTTFVADGALSELEFSVFAFRPNVPVGAQVAFNLDDVSMVDITPSAVPEPTAWALMIAGFGLAGASLRRRRPISA